MNISTQISTETLGNILKNFKLQDYFENDSLQAAIDQLLNDSETDIGITFQNIQEEDIERFNYLNTIVHNLFFFIQHN